MGGPPGWRRPGLILRWALAAAACLLPLACVGPGGGQRASPPADRLRVMAAASLAEVFGDVERSFEAAHPGTAVDLVFGASSALARQLHDGADADVFASADEATMEAVMAAGDATSPRSFARNRLTIVVEKGNPRRIQGVADLASPGLAVVACAPEVPCGRLAAAAFRRAGVDVRLRALEPDVKAVLARVALGEADAGLVYVTDALAARERVDEVVLAGTQDPTLQTVYRVAVVTRAAEPQLAQAWIDFLGGPQAGQALASRGFSAP